jgi:hypothetical protein
MTDLAQHRSPMLADRVRDTIELLESITADRA